MVLIGAVRNPSVNSAIDVQINNIVTKVFGKLFASTHLEMFVV